MSEEQRKHVAVVGAGAYVGGPLLRLLKNHGYKTTALVRPTSDTTSIRGVADELVAGDLADFRFIADATRGSVAIVNLVNQLNPPCKTFEEQLENDVPVLEACLHAGLQHDARVIYTSGNFSLPTHGRSGRIDETLAPRPAPDTRGFLSRWSTFSHIPEM